VTRLGRSTLLLNSKAPEQMTAECWHWRPRWNRHLDERFTLDQLLFKLIERKIVLYSIRPTELV